MLSLNPAQLQAVTHPGGPLLIVAGAGTGKTTVITERIKFLIQQKKVDPGRIFAATFTEKSANEMLNRLDDVMPLGYQEPYLGTFHALCDRLLKTEGLEIGLNPNYQIMTATDQWLFLKNHLLNLNLKYYRPLGNPNKFITALIKFFSRLSDEDVQPVEFKALLTSQKTPSSNPADQTELERLQELCAAYDRYTELKRTESVMDFGDLILYTLKLLRERPNLLQKYHGYFVEILVDEFQDTNYAQFELIKLLAPPETKPNLIVVGDDNQAIYKFRGASISNILQFKSLYPQSREIILTQNYRSTQSILDAAYQVIKHNDPETLEFKLGINKRLIAITKPKTDYPISRLTPQALSFPTLDAEIDWTAQEIVRLVTQENLNYQDIAILCRSNAQLEPYAAALRTYGLPYQLVANRGLFDQPEIKDLLHFLHALTDPNDNLALFAVTQMPLFALPPALVFDTLSQAKQTGTSLWTKLQPPTNPRVQALVDSVSQYRDMAATFPVTKLLYQFVIDTGYVNQFVSEDNLDNQLKLKNLNLFLGKLKQFEAITADRSVISFLDTLDLWLEAGEDPGQAQIEDIDTVSLMTVHAAKGLEFPAVFVGSLITGRFPATNRKDPIEVPPELIKETVPSGDINLQEERRLFYVALTRAKTHLYLTHALDLGGKRRHRVSGFVTETGLPLTSTASKTSSFPLVPAAKPPLIQAISGGTYQIKSVSYSKLDTFQVCPLKYKYRYLLQIPARPHHSLSFGRALHATLQQFHQGEIQGSQLSLPELLSLYEANWSDEGYESEAQKQERFAAGQAALSRYYDEYATLLGRPLMLEQSFKLKLAGVTLAGKIDRIEQTPDGSYAIVDYKTGAVKDQKAADTDEQLTVYALAAQEALGISAKTLSLYFLEGNGGKFTTTRSPEKLAKAKTKLIHQIETLKTSTFPPKPSPHTCGFCEYKRLCPYAKLK